jgi:PAT family beta-lactamase induction signal transducer AmpG
MKLSIYLQPKIIIILILSIASALPLPLTSSTLKIWMAESGIKLSTIGYLAGIGIVYSLKFLWAPLIDHVRLPIFSKLLGHRKSWIVLSQICLIVSIILLGNTDPNDNMKYIVIFAIMVAFFSATQDIVIDAYRIETLSSEQQAIGASINSVGYRIGLLLSGAGALYLSEYYSWDVVYMLATILILVSSIGVILAHEAKTSHKEHSGNVFTTMLDSLRDISYIPKWPYVLLFVILFKLGDAMLGVMSNILLLEIGFSKAEVATIVKVFGFGAATAGAFLGGVLAYRKGLAKSLWITAILQALTNILFIMQAYVGYNTNFLILTIASENLASGMGSTVFVAYLSSLCSKQYAATQYALLSALASIGRSSIATLSGLLVETIGWIPFLVVTVLAALPGMATLLVINLKPKHNNTKR